METSHAAISIRSISSVQLPTLSPTTCRTACIRFTTSSLFTITILTKLALKHSSIQVNKCFRYSNYKADTHLRVETMFKDLESRQQYKESWSSYASHIQRLLPRHNKPPTDLLLVNKPIGKPERRCTTIVGIETFMRFPSCSK